MYSPHLYRTESRTVQGTILPLLNGIGRDGGPPSGPGRCRVGRVPGERSLTAGSTVTPPTRTRHTATTVSVVSTTTCTSRPGATSTDPVATTIPCRASTTCPGTPSASSPDRGAPGDRPSTISSDEVGSPTPNGTVGTSAGRVGPETHVQVGPGK